jgi:hypothetical protein
MKPDFFTCPTEVWGQQQMSMLEDFGMVNFQCGGSRFG